jgi:phospho-N-acetylmuramoyl-pentapeptide-transferase
MEFFEAIRALILFAIAFVVALGLTPFVYHFLLKYGLKKRNIRDAKTAPVFNKFHKHKSDTPTMGGIIIWGTVLILALVFFAAETLFGGFANYFNFVDRAETYVPLAALIFAAAVGFIDDLLGVMGVGPKGGGLTMRHKLILYTIVSLVGAWWFHFRLGWSEIYIPFFGPVDAGLWYVLFFVFVIVATAFSANETDGLDGLAGGVLFFSFLALSIVAFVMHKYELLAMNAVLLGALLAFLWYNVHPAKFFMGDTGSMPLGITLGVIAMLTDTALFLPFFGFILVIESASVIIQLAHKKILKRKLFLSTPIHHHFQGIGWAESQITMRFWIISGAMTILGLIFFFMSRFI